MVDLRSVQAQSRRLGLEWQPGETANSSLSRLAARARTGAVPPGGKRVLNARVRAAARADHDGARAAAAALPPSVDWRKNGRQLRHPGQGPGVLRLLRRLRHDRRAGVDGPDRRPGAGP